jgi:hypothetical protein
MGWASPGKGAPTRDYPRRIPSLVPRPMKVAPGCPLEARCRENAAPGLSCRGRGPSGFLGILGQAHPAQEITGACPRYQLPYAAAAPLRVVGPIFGQADAAQEITGACPRYHWADSRPTSAFDPERPIANGGFHRGNAQATVDRPASQAGLTFEEGH